jgi:mannose/fructose/N-acetylgalactosamine-specific phosphotransferase system component IIB
MPIVLLRVDERLVHGQVTVGWAHALGPDRIIVVDDELAASGWEQDLYALGMPPDVDLAFLTLAQALAGLHGWQTGRERILVLTRDIATMERLTTGDRLPGAEVNLGGIHHAPGRHAILPYLYLSDDELAGVERMARAGLTVTARDLPGARRIDLAQLLEGRERRS